MLSRLITWDQRPAGPRFGRRRLRALPYSGLVLRIATELFEPASGDDRPELPVDLAAPITLADFLAGRYPVLAGVESGR